jgi:REP-associated tyrosine transposase
MLQIGGIYHVTARGNRRQEIFRSPPDQALYLGLLGTAVNRFAWDVFAYCLMPNHVHLVIRLRRMTLSEGIRWLHGTYAMSFNDRYALDGHLFGERFKPTPVERDEHLLEVARYVVLNPVRARLCVGPADWSWSSYETTAGIEAARPRFGERLLLARFGSRLDDARRRYRAFVAEGATT